MVWGTLARTGAASAARVGGKGALIAGGVAVGWQGLKDACPALEDEVIVEVKGQPGAVKQQLYYLALATAFGIVKRFDTNLGGKFLQPPAGMMMVEYDAADLWVRATLRFKTNLIWAAATASAQVVTGELIGGGAGAAAGSLLGPIGTVIGGIIGAELGGRVAKSLETYTSETPNPNGFYSQAVVYSGPKDEVVGGEFGFYGTLVPSSVIPTGPNAPGAPKLFFTGKEILTTAPSIMSGGNPVPTPNPTPPGDNRSRGTAPIPIPLIDTGLDVGTWASLSRRLIPMVFAALTDPGSYGQEQFSPPTYGPGGT